MTIRIIANWSSDLPGLTPGTSNAIAGFGIRTRIEGGFADFPVFNPAFDLAPQARFDFDGEAEVLESSAGQLANVLGLNPDIDTSNPIELYRFQVFPFSTTEPVDIRVVGSAENSPLTVSFYADTNSGTSFGFPFGAPEVSVVGYNIPSPGFVGALLVTVARTCARRSR